MTHTDRGSAHVRAPAPDVFAALIDAGAREVWLPPDGMSGRFERFDAKPGGGYRMVLSYDDVQVRGKTEENRDVVEVRFGVIDPPRRLVELVDFVSSDPALGGTMTITWSVTPEADGARVTITAVDVPDSLSAEQHEAAFAMTLANLDRHLAG
jgi:uncharacterized protein YndB with AHSA1/START domain